MPYTGEQRREYERRKYNEDPEWRSRRCASQAKWKKKNLEFKIQREREYQLSKYGLTEESYRQLLSNQGGCCAICRSSNPGGKNKNFAVDHDHETNKVRGLLCCQCNRGIGYLKDSPKIVESALLYLRGANATTGQ